MEVGAETVYVVLADKKSGGELRLLGGGEARVRGLENGEITNTGDLVEAVTEAAGKAQKSAAASIGKLYFNFDDAAVESAWPVGSRILDGEGEIQISDVRAAVGSAERIAGNFEKKIIYAAEAEYMIDDKDPVEEPVGIFGHKLDVKAHLVLVRAGRADAWSRLLDRAGFSRSTAVLSGFSSAHGVLNRQERAETRIVWDLDRDYLNGLVISGGRVLEYRTLLYTPARWSGLADSIAALCGEFKKTHPRVSETVFTGALAKDAQILAELKSRLEMPSRIGVPAGPSRLADASCASLAGLLEVAGEIEKKSIVMRPEKDTLSRARVKVQSFLSDYF